MSGRRSPECAVTGARHEYVTIRGVTFCEHCGQPHPATPPEPDERPSGPPEDE